MTTNLNASRDAMSSSLAHEREPIWRSLSVAMKSAIESYRQRAQARRDYQRLYTMSAHELEDIGLNRDMIRQAENDLRTMPFGPI